MSLINKPAKFVTDVNHETTLWMGIVGFIDDYLKDVKKISKGLVAKYKLLGQLMLGAIIVGVIYFAPQFADIDTLSTLPFFKDYEIDFGVFYIPMVIFVIIVTSNSVNLTDGLDGLAIGLVGISALAWAVIAYFSGRTDFSDYLNIIYLPGAGELTVYCAALVGASLGFLWFNSHPAQVFMGDTGSLALGSALGTLAILLKKELLLIIIGGVFAAETLSVIIQVLYYKYTKKRVFKMAPIHHHFELSGWSESTVVVRFWIIAIEKMRKLYQHLPLLSEMFGYATSLRSLTQGRAIFTLQFAKYDVAPKAVSGTVGTGRVDRGKIKTGDNGEIIGLGAKLNRVVTGVEMFRKLLDYHEAGDNVNMEDELIAPIAMEQRLRLAIREGGRTVGAGIVG